MPPAQIDPLGLLRKLMKNRKCTFQMKSVTLEDVEKIINSLSNSSAFGLDNLDTQIIKLIGSEILTVITYIVNLSIKTKKFPHSWKQIKVIPLHKKDDILNPKNYRPVAMVPVLSKVLERVVHNQMIEYLESNNLIHPNSHGYRQHHNTETALISMYDSWVRALDRGELCGVVCIDQSAAFDVVSHNLLLEKLKLYGFGNDELDWIKSYLSDRSQCVCIDGELSDLLPIHHGVPQGSILGPLLFTMYTNELPEVGSKEEQTDTQTDQYLQWPPYQSGELVNFADDATFSSTAKNAGELSDILSEKYGYVAEFLTANQLKINDDKTHIMIMTSGRPRAIEAANQVVLRTPTSEVKTIRKEKLLGCVIQNNCKWSEHIRDDKDNNLITGLNKRVGALRKISKVASFQQRKIFGNGIFMSKINYCIALWGGCNSELIRSLQVCQNRAARIITRCDWSVSSSENLRQIGWLNIKQTIFYFSALLVYKIKNQRSPKCLADMFDWQYVHQTRAATSGIVKPIGVPRLSLTKDSFRWRAAAAFNSLPEELRNCVSIQLFKTKLKSWIKENVNQN